MWDTRCESDVCAGAGAGASAGAGTGAGAVVGAWLVVWLVAVGTLPHRNLPLASLAQLALGVEQFEMQAVMVEAVFVLLSSLELAYILLRKSNLLRMELRRASNPIHSTRVRGTRTISGESGSGDGG